MAATEDSGVFDVGTFDNAEFDTIEQPSTVNIFSRDNSTFDLSVSSTVNVFSDFGREITRDLTSFVDNIDSSVEAQRQILRRATSLVSVFSQSDFRLGKKVISTINVQSEITRQISITRVQTSTVNVASQIRTIYELITSSSIKSVSNVEYDRIYNRAVNSTLTVLSSAVRVIPGFQLFLETSATTAVKVKNKATKIFSIENEAS